MKFVKWGLIVIVSVPLIAVSAIYIRTKAAGPTGWAKDDTIKALRAKMKDPDSMVIRSYYFVHRPEGDDGAGAAPNRKSGSVHKPQGDRRMGIFMCGIVDAKNSFGGYTGGMRFASISYSSKSYFDFVAVHLEDPKDKRLSTEVGWLSGFEKVYWNEYCVDAEHPPITAPSG